MPTDIRLVALPEQTNFAPLGVLGYCLTRTDFLAPVFTDLHLPIKKVRHASQEKLLDILVSILAGCRSIQQVNTRIRPDSALACAWGRRQFAEQSTLSRTLEAFDHKKVGLLRQGSEALFRCESRALRHDLAQDWLYLDIDLTPLPISKHAQGSLKGKIGGEKTDMVVNWPVFMHRNTGKRYSRSFTLATRTVIRPTSLQSRP